MSTISEVRFDKFTRPRRRVGSRRNLVNPGSPIKEFSNMDYGTYLYLWGFGEPGTTSLAPISAILKSNAPGTKPLQVE
jgi:hypothetical protein